MYLSTLLINVGDNPDRPRPGRTWLGNIYHVHQRLCMAFPSETQRRDDPHFLRPFAVDGFPLLRAPNTPAESPRHSFLFRIDNTIRDCSSRAIIIVQSLLEPQWDYAFRNARVFLAADPEWKRYDPAFVTGEELRFRIRVNLSKKIKKSASGADLRIFKQKMDTKGRPKAQGKRVALTWNADEGPADATREWFSRKAMQNGFQLGDFRLLHLGWVTGYRPGANSGHMQGDAGRQMRFRSALLEGTLRVVDAAAFANGIAKGIGSAKAFGFGLLSVAPIRQE